MSDYSWRDTPAITARSRTFAQYPAPAAWTPPTGDTWRLVRVAPDERTCLACGDTFCGEYCTRCGARDEQGGAPRAVQPPSVPTLRYLRDGEYEVKS